MNWKLGTNYKFDDLGWDFFHKDPVVEKAFWDIHDLYDTTYLRRAMPPVDPYAFPVIKELMKTNKVEIVTRNDPKGRDTIRAWIFMHGLDAPVRTIGREKRIEGGKARMPYDVFVDDNPLMVPTILKHPSKRLILFDRSWNRDTKVGKNVFRAKDWLEVRKILHGMGAL